MRTFAVAATLLAGTLLAACASGWTISQSGVVLGPGGSASGSVVFPPGEKVVLRLRNRGPGSAEFAVKDAAGRVIQAGALGEATVEVTASDPEPLLLHLQAHDDGGTTVLYSIAAQDSIRVDWDLSAANR